MTGYARFRSLLQSISLSSLTNYRVLELGCGDQIDVIMYPPGAWLVGIDISLTALRRVSSTSPTAARCLIQANITRLPLGPQRPVFDLIVSRHPDVDAHPAAWQQALTDTPQWLSAAGHLVLTCYALHEAETLRGWLKLTPLVQLSIDERQLIPPDLAGRDRFALVYGRQ